jgi:hypothetical protein
MNKQEIVDGIIDAQDRNLAEFLEVKDGLKGAELKRHEEHFRSVNYALNTLAFDWGLTELLAKTVDQRWEDALAGKLGLVKR